MNGWMDGWMERRTAKKAQSHGQQLRRHPLLRISFSPKPVSSFSIFHLHRCSTRALVVQPCLDALETLSDTLVR